NQSVHFSHTTATNNCRFSLFFFSFFFFFHLQRRDVTLVLSLLLLLATRVTNPPTILPGGFVGWRNRKLATMAQPPNLPS
ncbi:hypothetical protein F4778DRAFT_755354, partial [Xylariomycetidae sp. FL2044]